MRQASLREYYKIAARKVFITSSKHIKYSGFSAVSVTVYSSCLNTWNGKPINVL